MKKQISFLAMILFLISGLSGQDKPNYVGEWFKQQSQGKSPVQTVGFDLLSSNFTKTKRYNLKANINQLSSIMNTKPEIVSIAVPYGDRVFTLDLARVHVVDSSFEVNGVQDVSSYIGVQYRGIVNGNLAHIASVNLSPTDKSIFFSTDEGNFIVTQDGKDYIVYNDKVVKSPDKFVCETEDLIVLEPLESDLTEGVGCKTVKVYFECDYAFYQSKGSSVANVTNYVVGFFNQIATLYANENIAIQISNIFVWTTPDPYRNYTSPSAILTPFRTNRGTSFNGNLAHFLTTRNIGGGVAYLNTLCNKAYAYGVSRIYTTYSSFPTYSWTVEVVAHELGHNVGSPHTHSCSWSGGALDNCYPPEGTCAAGPAPVNGGTVMSYCHLTNYGINFNNGFGVQPGNLLRSRVQNATCLPVEGSGTAPSNLTTTNITSSSATLNWSAVAGVEIYTVQYRLASSSTWTVTTSTTNSKAITGLTAGSTYVWTVKADCSPFAPNASFTTTGIGTCTAPSGLATTNITQTSATLSWAPVSGATSYTVQYKSCGGTAWSTLPSTVSTSRTISGLSVNGSYTWQVRTNCSIYSTVRNFTTQ